MRLPRGALGLLDGARVLARVQAKPVLACSALRACARLRAGRGAQSGAASLDTRCARGAYSQGRIAKVRFYSAMASASEVLACLDVAARLKYVRIEPGTRDRLDKIIGTLRKLSRR